ncbi:MAG: TonB-dependent receptor plug domain-containing protein, partial [Verrucomicrobiae bacterium]|nr:TonB-dependent receptor plug domain-containing protein [Verrucomicrobiae bacterium]
VYKRQEPTAGQVTSVSEKQIEDLNAQDLPSALRRTPGVVVSRFNPIGSFGGAEGGAVFIRGHGSSRPGAEILTAIDGVPLYVGLWTHPLMDTFSVDTVDRIDVYKGAQPVLFGNMASAVINIIPKRKQEEGFTTSIEGARGSYNTWIETAEHGGKVDGFDYYLIQSYRTSDGHRDYADGEVRSMFGRVGYTFNENWDASILFNKTESWAHDPGPDAKRVGTAKAYRNGRFSVDDNFTIWKVSNRYDVAEGYVKFYWDDGDIDWENQYNTTTKKNTSDTLTDYDNYGMKAREIFRLWPGGEVLTGVDVDYISGKAKFITVPKSGPKLQRFDRETFRIVSPHTAVTQRFDLAEDIHLTPSVGFRYYNHDYFKEDEVAPQAGLLFGVKDTEFHANFARNVNYPGVFALAQSAIFLPGENKESELKAEEIDHYEVGVSQRFGKLVKADLDLFYDAGDNRIVTAKDGSITAWKNIGKYRSEGIEATVTVTPVKDLALFAGATYLRHDPSDLPYSPRWSASFGVTYRFLKYFQISLDASYVDEQYVASRGRSATAVNTDQVDDYFLLSGKLTYDFQLPFWNMKGQVFLAGENLTNTYYEQRNGYPMPRINGMGGVKLKF